MTERVLCRPLQDLKLLKEALGNAGRLGHELGEPDHAAERRPNFVSHARDHELAGFGV